MANPQYAPQSDLCAAAEPDRLIATSADVAWRSLRLDHLEGAGASAPFETRATPDITLVVATAGVHRVEVYKNGRWRAGVYQPGAAGLTPGWETTHMRWASLKDRSSFRTAHLYLPYALIHHTAEEYRRIGARHVDQPLNSLVFRDAALLPCVSALLRAIEEGSPDLYAEHAARWLATHLLASHAGWWDGDTDQRDPGVISDRRLARVFEYMSSNLSADLNLTELAREGGVSVHHFGRLFSQRIGHTPVAFLTRLRMDLARRLLRTTDQSIAEIASACGYGRPAAFAAAFARHHHMSPTAYRLGRSGIA
jgi:AraC family transcriptional regulator